MGSPPREEPLTRACTLLAVLSLVALPVPGQHHGTDHFRTHGARIEALCKPIIGARSGTLTQQALALDVRFRAHPDDSLRLAAACARGAAYAHETAVWKVGSTLKVDIGAAIHQFVDHLKAHPADSLAAEALALIALDLSDGPMVMRVLGDRQEIAARMYTAVRVGVRVPSVIRACAHFELLVGDVATARRCMQIVLHVGADSSWYLLRAAFLERLQADSSRAVELTRLASVVARDSAAKGDVTFFLRMVDVLVADSTPGATPPELVARVLSRGEFLGADFALCPPQFWLNGSRLSRGLTGCPAYKRDTIPRIELLGTLMHLWEPSTLLPMAVIAFDARRGSLTMIGEGSAAVATSDINFRLFEWQSDRWVDTTWVAYPVALAKVRNPEHAVGLLKVPNLNLPGSWSLTLRQGEREGRVSVDGVWPLDGVDLSLSDLIVGQREQGLVTTIGEDSVVLAPRNTLSPSEPAQLWLQFMNRGARRDLKTSIVLRRISDGQVAKVASLSMATLVPVPPGLSTFTRGLSFSRLDRGDYQLTVELSESDGAVVARRVANLFLR